MGANVHLAITLLEDRTRPILKPAISFGDADVPRFEVSLPGDEHWMSEAWSKVFIPMLDENLALIAASVDEQIARVYRKLRSLGSDSDTVSFGRSAIEPHEQDSFREPMDMLIDAARDCIEHALAHDVPLANRCIDSWASRSEPLFHRLAVHAWRMRGDRTADEKLRWLEERNWLWEISPQHEVYLLLQETLPAASGELVQVFVEAAKAGPPADGVDEISPYRSYNLLAWLAQSAPDRSGPSQAFEESQAAHPEFAAREHPDLNSYMSSGFVEDSLPYSAEELHARIANDVEEAVTALRDFQSNSFPFTGPTWTGALRSLQACVSAYPSDGATVATVLRSDDADLRNAIIRGWDTAQLDEPAIGAALAAIDGWDPDEVRRVAAMMLSNGGTQTNPTSWHKYAQARRIASSLWPARTVAGVISEGEDLVMEAINHPAGDLAEFWTKAVQWDWTQAGDEWAGLTNELTRELDRLISADDRNGLLASTFLASQLHFYFAADQVWASSRLLPLFDWSKDESRARGAWQGLLTCGRPNDGLLAAGLLDDFVETCRHGDALGSRLSHKLGAQLASIALHAGADPLQWLPRFVLAAQEDLRVSWAHRFGRALEELESDEAGAQWERWIRTYWSGRLQSTPLPLTSAEASAMAGWVIGLPSFRGEAVSLLRQTPAGLSQQGRFLHRIHDLDLTQDAATWAIAITHLLQGTTGPVWVLSRYLKGIVQQLRAADPAPDLSALIEEALRLGVTDAAEW